MTILQFDPDDITHMRKFRSKRNGRNRICWKRLDLITAWIVRRYLICFSRLFLQRLATRNSQRTHFTDNM